MTVVSKDASGRIIAYSKGGDVKMLPNFLRGTTGIVGQDQKELLMITQSHVDEYACSGSRVLVAAFKKLNEPEFKCFFKRYKEAASSITRRQELIEEAFLQIENNMRLIGCTAVEDKIQDGVKEAIHDFKTARIKVMMLTGDKKETAVTIAQLSGIIEREKLVWIEPPGDIPLKDQYLQIIKDIKSNSSKSALVINGDMLEQSITYHTSEFKQVFNEVVSIICNRAAPAQKALIVRWVRENFSGVSLAIGDGANDVSMIQSSNVGVGIMGKEGTQAALASDFIIYRFNFLKKLLFVHGRYNYLRTSKVVLICIYKNLACILPLC